MEMKPSARAGGIAYVEVLNYGHPNQPGVLEAFPAR